MESTLLIFVGMATTFFNSIFQFSQFFSISSPVFRAFLYFEPVLVKFFDVFLVFFGVF